MLNNGFFPENHTFRETVEKYGTARQATRQYNTEYEHFMPDT